MKNSFLIRDKKRREIFKKYEIRRIILKSMLCNKFINFKEKNCIRYILNKFPKNSSATKLKNRCIVTGRNGSIVRKFRISRIILKQYSLLGWISGMKKSS